jgi:hypothetical protein
MSRVIIEVDLDAKYYTWSYNKHPILSQTHIIVLTTHLYSSAWTISWEYGCIVKNPWSIHYTSLAVIIGVKRL